MKTKLRGLELDEQVRPTAIESVTFRDGMIVTADDLDAAQRYPVSLLRTVLRSYLGCGVVCGLGLRVKETTAKPNWVVCVERGVAIDCHGYPIELCTSVELDLSPDPCDSGDPPATVCIAVRRSVSEEAPRDACSCDVDAPHFDCRRVRDHVVVKAFTEAELDALPEANVCRRSETDQKSQGCGQPPNGGTDAGTQSWSDALCGSLTSCSPCSCGDCWVLLGCVSLAKDIGISGQPDTTGRRWVKPIEALCPTLITKITELEDKVAVLAKKVADLDGLGDRVKKLEEHVGGRTGLIGQTSPAAQGTAGAQSTSPQTAPGP